MIKKKRLGRTPKPKKEKYVVETWSMPPDVPPVVDAYAEANGLSRSAAAAQLIKAGARYLEKKL